MRFLSIALCWLAATSAALAEDASSPPGWYVGAQIGGAFAPDRHVGALTLANSRLFPAPDDLLSYHSGWVGAVAAGYDTGKGWRAEVEIGARRNSVAAAFGNPTTILGLGTCVITVPNCASVGATGGATKVMSYMVDGLYDIPTGGRILPHIGLGFGIAQVHQDNVGQPRGILLNGSATAFAYQPIAGLSYRLTPRVSFDVDYRYFHAARRAFDPNAFATPRPTADYASHAVTVGLRYRFL